jgi:excisionase family DNA binding protein
MITELPMFLRQYEVAELFNCDKKVIQRHAKRGTLTPIKDGRAVYFRREEVVGLAELRKK